MSQTAASGECSYSKANGTRGEHPGTEPPDETTLDEHGVDEKLTKYDWLLPGLGEEGPKCEVDAVPPGNAICPNGDSVRYEPLRCRRVECPNCYKDEQLDRVFRITVELEGYAIVNDERPHAVAASVPEDVAESWTYERLNTSLMRRGYRRMRRQCDIIGGYGVLHPWRLRRPIKKKLERHGFGPGGDRGGYWKGVREDVLEYGDSREYARFSPHMHNIGYPQFIEPHEGEDFVVAKYDVLEELEDVVRHTRYLLSHRGVRDGDEVGRSVRPWGAFHHAGTDWGGAEEELGEARYGRLAEQVAEILGMVWDPEEGLMYEDSQNCPCCGTSVDEFHDLRELPDLVDGFAGMGEPWVETLETEQRRFFVGLFEEWRATLDDPDMRGVELDDMQIPNSVTVWSADSDASVTVGDHPEGQGDFQEETAAADEVGKMDQRKRRAMIRQKAVGRGAPRDEIIEAIDAPKEKLENDIEQLLRNGRLIDAGLNRVMRS